MTQNRSLQSVKSAESVEEKPVFLYALGQESSRGLNLDEIHFYGYVLGPTRCFALTCA